MDSTQQTSLNVVAGTFVDTADSKRLARLHAQAIALPDEFCEWLELNWPIWDEFVKLSDQMRTRGRAYYSARAVMHVLRWHRALKDPTETDYKINNNRSAAMARLYNSMRNIEFFRTRGRAVAGD